MDNLLVVVFDTEAQAYQGYRALKEMHAEGIITLYAESVITKDADGSVKVREEARRGPLGTAVGLVAGSLVRWSAGRMGERAGAAVDTLGGETGDYAVAAVGTDFLDEVSIRFGPGKAAVVAEVGETSTLPLDVQMEARGGTVLRAARSDTIQARVGRDLAAIEAGLAVLEAEYKHANQEAQSKLQGRIDAAKAQHELVLGRARARIDATQCEAQAKIAALREQAALARPDRKQELETRAAEVDAERRRLSQESLRRRPRS